MDEDGLYYLYLREYRRDGKTHNTYLPMYEEGTKRPDWPPDHIWVFRRDGDTLHCHPSLNDLSFKCHNGAHWDVVHVEWLDTPEYTRGPGGMHDDINMNVNVPDYHKYQVETLQWLLKIGAIKKIPAGFLA